MIKIAVIATGLILTVLDMDFKNLKRNVQSGLKISGLIEEKKPKKPNQTACIKDCDKKDLRSDMSSNQDEKLPSASKQKPEPSERSSSASALTGLKSASGASKLSLQYQRNRTEQRIQEEIRKPGKGDEQPFCFNHSGYLRNRMEGFWRIWWDYGKRLNNPEQKRSFHLCIERFVRENQLKDNIPPSMPPEKIWSLYSGSECRQYLPGLKEVEKFQKRMDEPGKCRRGLMGWFLKNKNLENSILKNLPKEQNNCHSTC